MAVNTETNQGSNKAQAQSQTTQQRPGRMGLSDINNRFSGSVSRYGHSEYLTRWESAFRGFMTEHKAHFEDLHLCSLDAQKDMMPFSTLVLVHPFEVNGKVSVCAYALVIEASGEALADGVATVPSYSGQRTVPVKYVPSDLWSNDLIAKIRQLILSEITTDLDQVISTGFTVIPSESSPEDKEVVKQFFLWADNANAITARTILGAPPLLNVAELPTQESTPKFITTYHNDDLVTAGGLPVRRDVQIDCILDPTAQANASPLSAKSAVALTRATGYVEPLFAPSQAPQPINNNGTFVGGTQFFSPLFVITRLESMLDTNSLTTQLLALASTAVMATTGAAWAAPLNPKRRAITGKSTVDLRDIGVIGYEWGPNFGKGPIGDRIDTRSNTFGEGDFSNLIMNAFQQNLRFAIDIPRGDEVFWLNEVFLAAANNANPESQRQANEMLVKAASVLTDGRFRWDLNKPIFTNVGCSMYFGYYTEDDGTKRDIRNISDRLAIRNLYAKNDPSVIAQWEATFDDLNTHEAIRLDQRIRILDGITGGKFKVKDSGPRLLIEADFINALVQALVEARFTVKPEGVESLQQQQQGFTSSFLSSGAVGNVNGLYQQTTNFGGQANNGFNFTRF